MMYNEKPKVALKSNSGIDCQEALAHFISDSFIWHMKCTGKLAASSKGAINYRICQLCLRGD